jgi:hypothetical protein
MADLSDDHKAAADLAFRTCARFIAENAAAKVRAQLANCDYSRSPGLRPEERDRLQTFAFAEADIDQIETAVRQGFVDDGLGLARLQILAHRRASRKALSRSIDHYSKKAAVAPLEYYASKYAALMTMLALPYNDLLFIDNNLCANMPSAPVRSGAVPSARRHSRSSHIAIKGL